LTQAVLVAGGAGYIGAHTCKALHKAGYLPVTIDSLVTGYEAAVKWGPLIKADVRDRSAILEVIAQYKIKSAIHFAAFSLVGESMTQPAKYYDNNVGAALAFTEALVESGVEAIVFSSTAAAYGIPRSTPISETDPLMPINPYGGSKVAFEGALHWMCEAHPLRYTILRDFNAAGADPEGEIGESHVPETHLIPLVCRAALGTGKPLSVFGTDYDTRDGTAVRDYIHVQDLANAHVAAIERLMRGGKSEVYNVGTGHGVTVMEILETAEKVLGKPVPHSIAPRRSGDPEVLVADVAKISSDLSWKAVHSDLSTIISTAARWQANPRY
jgi:UDP-glucose-4-epimerase GalE